MKHPCKKTKQSKKQEKEHETWGITTLIPNLKRTLIPFALLKILQLVSPT